MKQASYTTINHQVCLTLHLVKPFILVSSISYSELYFKDCHWVPLFFIALIFYNYCKDSPWKM